MFKGAIQGFDSYSRDSVDHLVAISDFGEIRSQKIEKNVDYLESKLFDLELEMNEIIEGELTICSKDSYIVVHSLNIETDRPEHLFIIKIFENNSLEFSQKILINNHLS